MDCRHCIPCGLQTVECGVAGIGSMQPSPLHHELLGRPASLSGFLKPTDGCGLHLCSFPSFGRRQSRASHNTTTYDMLYTVCSCTHACAYFVAPKRLKPQQEGSVGRIPGTCCIPGRSGSSSARTKWPHGSHLAPLRKRATGGESSHLRGGRPSDGAKLKVARLGWTTHRTSCSTPFSLSAIGPSCLVELQSGMAYLSCY